MSDWKWKWDWNWGEDKPDDETATWTWEINWDEWKLKTPLEYFLMFVEYIRTTEDEPEYYYKLMSQPGSEIYNYVFDTVMAIIISIEVFFMSYQIQTLFWYFSYHMVIEITPVWQQLLKWLNIGK